MQLSAEPAVATLAVSSSTPAPKTTATKYRPDIDGLRAIAVLAVLGYHAFPQWVPGGFVGVDVFFVISGYLITLVLMNDLRRRTFSLAGFYGRRIRRIFPALVVVLAAVTLAGWLCLLSTELKYVGKHVAAGAAFASNFASWRETGYFAPEARMKPLLHLWSLGIEEQFYLIWPVLLYVAFRLRINMALLMLLLVVSSFWLAFKYASSEPLTGFFTPWARAWELAAGGLLTVLELGRRRSFYIALPSFAKPILACAGIAAILFASIRLGAEGHYPGIKVVLPVAGAWLLIAVGPHNWISRHVLSQPAVVFCGLISFPLYLWHYPLLTGSRLLGVNPNMLACAVLLIVSFILAVLTYRFVERPMRFGPYPALNTGLLCGLLAIIAATGWAIERGSIHPHNDSAAIRRIEEARNDWHFPGSLQPFDFNGRTFYQTAAASAGDRTVLYFGDSNMEQYAPRIVRLTAESPQRYPRAVFATQGGCTPLPHFLPPSRASFCGAFVQSALAYAQSPAVSTVVVSALWEIYIVAFTSEYKATGPADAYQDLEHMLAGFRRSGKSVLLILPMPIGQELSPTSAIVLDYLHHPFLLKVEPKSMPLRDFELAYGDCVQKVKAAAQRAGAQIIDPADTLCPNAICPSFDKDRSPRYKDTAHLRAAFVRDHATFIDSTLR